MSGAAAAAGQQPKKETAPLTLTTVRSARVRNGMPEGQLTIMLYANSIVADYEIARAETAMHAKQCLEKYKSNVETHVLPPVPIDPAARVYATYTVHPAIRPA